MTEKKDYVPCWQVLRREPEKIRIDRISLETKATLDNVIDFFRIHDKEGKYAVEFECKYIDDSVNDLSYIKLFANFNIGYTRVNNIQHFWVSNTNLSFPPEKN